MLIYVFIHEDTTIPPPKHLGLPALVSIFKRAY